MAFGDAIKALGDRYKSYRGKVKNRMIEAQEQATIAAIDKATELTPPVPGDRERGVNALTEPHAKENWKRDSVSVPIVTNNTYKTYLVNTAYYISFLDEGHWVDMHFVPHLFINAGTGLLDKLPGLSGGIVVGTQTEYIPGLYFKEQAIDAYKKEIREILGRGVIAYAESSGSSKHK